MANRRAAVAAQSQVSQPSAAEEVEASYQGSDGKVRCAVPGCSYEGHILVAHLRDVHGLDPENYNKIHPLAPLVSQSGRERLLTPAGSSKRIPVREKRLFSVRETFGIDLGLELDGAGQPVLDPDTGKPKLRDKAVIGFQEPTEFTPAINPHYVFPPEETQILLMGFASKDRILITGGTGTGKTSLVLQVSARLNYSVIRINFDGGVTRGDLLGEWIIKGRDMSFMYGVLCLAFEKPGCVVLLDEWDSIGEECSFVLQRPLEKEDGSILLMETGGELIHLHEDNLIVATGNTIGQGDDTGLYAQGTRVQNYSQINRFGLTIRLGYLPPEKEKEMIHKQFPGLESSEVDAFVLAINKVRDGYSNGQISVPLSPRDLINWVDKYISLGDPMKAAKYCFLNRMSSEDSEVTKGIITRTFESL